MDYPYANGVIKAIENNLFDKPKYAKLAKTDRKDFVSALYGFGYGKGTGTEELDDVIQSELAGMKQLLDAIFPNRRFTDLFYLPYDAMNLKVLYKEKMYEVSRPDILVGIGAIEPLALAEAVTTGNLSVVPPEYVLLLENVRLSAEQAASPRDLSARIDSEVFRFAFAVLKKTPRGALHAYFEAYVDFANVITMMRARTLRWSGEAFREMLLLGGVIPHAVFTGAYPLEAENLPREFREYYGDKVTRCLKKFLETGNLDRLERLLDQLLLEIVKESRHDPFGIGPIIFYFLKKNAEAKNIRKLYAEGSADLADLLD